LFRTKKEIYQFIAAQRPSYSLTMLCWLYNLSRFGFYSWEVRGQSKHDLKDDILQIEIKRIYEIVRGFYGCLKTHAKLKQQGIIVGKQSGKDYEAVQFKSTLCKNIALSCQDGSILCKYQK